MSYLPHVTKSSVINNEGIHPVNFVVFCGSGSSWGLSSLTYSVSSLKNTSRLDTVTLLQCVGVKEYRGITVTYYTSAIFLFPQNMQSVFVFL